MCNRDEFERRFPVPNGVKWSDKQGDFPTSTRLTEKEKEKEMIRDRRKLFEVATEECKRPQMGRGCLLYWAYEKVIDEVCRDIAGRYATEGEIEVAREEYGL